MAIRFSMGTFMPGVPPAQVRDRFDVNLPQATSRSFVLDGSAWEYPTYENAETFVARLVRRGLLAHDHGVDLSFDMAIKLLQLPIAVTSTMELGYPAGAVAVIGAIEAVCLALYLWPRTALLGAVLLVGYLGGAVATHLRVGNPLFSHMLFPVCVAGLLWLGLWLRNGRVRQIVRDAFRA